MNSKWLPSSIVVFYLFSIWSTHHVHCQTNLFTVVESEQTNAKQVVYIPVGGSEEILSSTIRVPLFCFSLPKWEFLSEMARELSFVIEIYSHCEYELKNLKTLIKQLQFVHVVSFKNLN